MRRALVLLAAAAISLAATFGGPEEVDPKSAPQTLGYGIEAQLGVDGSGRAYWLTERLDDQFEGHAYVLERCGGAWELALDVANGDPMIQDLAVAPSGAAVAVWVENLDVLRTAYRAPAGTWGPPQTLQTTGQVESADAAIDANGDVVLAWQGVQSDKVSASYRPAATGVWEQPTELAGFGNPRVAILNGSAIVTASDAKVIQDKILAFPRPWGGQPEVVVDHNGNMRGGGWLEYDPVSGRAMLLYSEGPVVGRSLRALVRNGGAWTLSAELEFLASGFLNPWALVRHRDGLVAVWTSDSNASMNVRRFNGTGWDTLQNFKPGGTFEYAAAGANAEGETVVAGSRDGEIWGATAAGIGGAWSGLARLSAAGPGWRFPLAAGGGGRLVVAWGDHRGGQQRTLAAVSGACTAAPPPQPTATATPAPTPQPPPPPANPQSKPKPVTIADVVTLPSAKKCRDSLKLKFRKPAKRVAMTVNGKKIKVKIGKAVTIKLRKRTTLKITVTLADGSKLKSTARFKPC